MNRVCDWKDAIIKSDRRFVVPIMTHPGISLCGCTVCEAVTDGYKHAEVIKKLNDVYPADASTAIMDLTVEAEAFGAEVIFPENEIPSVKGRLVTDRQQVTNLAVPDLESGRVKAFLTTDRIVRQAICDTPVFAGCIGPFSLAGRLFGMSELMMALYIEPDTIQILLDKCTQFLELYIGEIKKTGVAGVIIAEPAAGLVSNDDCYSYSSVYIKKLVSLFQDDDFMIILHNCGNSGHCTDAMVRSDAAALHFGNQIDMVQALRDCPSDRLVMGNLDPVGILKMSDPECVYNETLSLLERTSDRKNYVLSTGCDVPPHVPEDNIKAFYNAIKKYNSVVKVHKK